MVVPAARPVTLPAPSIVPTPGVPELHVPPVVASVNEVEPPMHAVAVPLIVPAAEEAFTLMTTVAFEVPQPLVTA